MFGQKKTPAAPTAPLRRDRVRDALKADMDFEAAIDRDVDGADFSEVQRRHQSAFRGLNEAEMSFLREARERHGYGG